LTLAQQIAQLQGEGLTPEQIIEKMVGQGFKEEEVTSVLNSETGKTSLTTTQVQTLRDQGMGDDEIRRLLMEQGYSEEQINSVIETLNTSINTGEVDSTVVDNKETLSSSSSELDDTKETGMETTTVDVGIK